MSSNGLTNPRQLMPIQVASQILSPTLQKAGTYRITQQIVPLFSYDSAQPIGSKADLSRLPARQWTVSANTNR